MKIIALKPRYEPEIVQGIAQAYQQAFAGYPWYESWEINTIISDFKKEMKKPEAVCVIAQLHKKIIGFTWGYKISSNPMLDKHLDASGLHKILSGDYFYLDEVAIIPDLQKKGIGGELINKIFGEQTYEQVLLRTKEDGPMFKLITKRGGEIIQHISQNRVIMKISTKK